MNQKDFASKYIEIAPALAAWTAMRIPLAVRRHLDPEDVVQEVCCRSLERVAEYDPDRGSFRSWLFGIAANVMREALVDVGRRKTQEPSSNSGWSRSTTVDLPADLTSVSRRVCRGEALASLMEQIATLEDEDRRLLLYRGLEGLSHAEVARILGLSVAAVEKRWQRLQKQIEGWRIPSDLFAS